ncbi:Endonuclease 8-like 3 [Bienertia sinuspersici]
MNLRTSSNSTKKGKANCAKMRCQLGFSAIVQTTKKLNENHGKRFYCCPLWKVDGCQFFQWIDDENYGQRAIESICGYAREIVELNQQLQQVKNKIDDGEEGVQIRAVEELKEYKTLKKKNKKLIEEIGHVRRKNKLLVVILMISCFMFYMYSNM